MKPGENCLSCHNGSNREAPKYTVAGTVFETSAAATTAGIEGVTVIITDPNGAETRLTTNAAGNFYTTRTITAPYTVVVERNGHRTAMNSTPTGGCGSCHTTPPANGAPGRLYATP